MEDTDPTEEMEPVDHRPDFGQLPGLVEILFVIFLVIILGWGGSQIAQMIARSSGQDLDTLLKTLGENNILDNRNLVRLANLVVHFMSFTLPCLLLAIFIRRNKWYEYLSLNVRPETRILALASVLIFVAMPFTSLIYWINMQIPLPEWATSLEQGAEEMINALLTMESPAELLFNLLIIALVPAIGEELLFRGVFQKVLTKSLKNEHTAIWITAFLFSMMHMQFEGFFPRFLLGAILGYLFSWSKNLWVPITAHLVFNGIQVILKYFAGGLMENMEAGSVDQPPWFLGIISLVFTIALAVHLKRALKKEETA